MVGLPNFLSITTLRPLGPMVALTAAAMMLTPRSRAARPSSLNITCFGMLFSPPGIVRDGPDQRPVGVGFVSRPPRARRASRRSGVTALFDDPEHILFAQDQVLLV